MYVCMFAYSSRKDIDYQFAENLVCFFFEARKRFQTNQNCEKVFLSSRADEGVSCSLNTKDDRRMAPITKLFASSRRLQSTATKYSPVQRCFLQLCECLLILKMLQPHQSQNNSCTFRMADKHEKCLQGHELFTVYCLTPFINEWIME